MTIDRNSRYANTPEFSGGSFRGTRPRAILGATGIIEHTITAQDRLDRLAAHYYDDPRKWWLILDANPEISFGGDLDVGCFEGLIIVIPADERRRRPR